MDEITIKTFYVAPHILYLPYYLGLKKMQNEKKIKLEFEPCGTDEKVRNKFLDYNNDDNTLKIMLTDDIPEGSWGKNNSQQHYKYFDLVTRYPIFCTIKNNGKKESTGTKIDWDNALNGKKVCTYAEGTTIRNFLLNSLELSDFGNDINFAMSRDRIDEEGPIVSLWEYEVYAELGKMLKTILLPPPHHVCFTSIYGSHPDVLVERPALTDALENLIHAVDGWVQKLYGSESDYDSFLGEVLKVYGCVCEPSKPSESVFGKGKECSSLPGKPKENGGNDFNNKYCNIAGIKEKLRKYLDTARYFRFYNVDGGALEDKAVAHLFEKKRQERKAREWRERASSVEDFRDRLDGLLHNLDEAHKEAEGVKNIFFPHASGVLRMVGRLEKIFANDKEIYFVYQEEVTPEQLKMLNSPQAYSFENEKPEGKQYLLITGNHWSQLDKISIGEWSKLVKVIAHVENVYCGNVIQEFLKNSSVISDTDEFSGNWSINGLEITYTNENGAFTTNDTAVFSLIKLLTHRTFTPSPILEDEEIEGYILSPWQIITILLEAAAKNSKKRDDETYINYGSNRISYSYIVNNFSEEYILLKQFNAPLTLLHGLYDLIASELANNKNDMCTVKKIQVSIGEGLRVILECDGSIPQHAIKNEKGAEYSGLSGALRKISDSIGVGLQFIPKVGGVRTIIKYTKVEKEFQFLHCAYSEKSKTKTKIILFLPLIKK